MLKFRITLAVTMICLLAAGSGYGQAAADLYKAKCAMCHGPDGAGKTPAGQKMGAHDLKAPEVMKQSDAQMMEITTKGKGKMPAFAGKLTDAQMKDVVAFIRDLQKKK